jgi:hypothetical protein
MLSSEQWNKPKPLTPSWTQQADKSHKSNFFTAQNFIAYQNQNMEIKRVKIAATKTTADVTPRSCDAVLHSVMSQ